MGDEREAIEFIGNLLEQFDKNSSLEYKVYHLVCKQNMNGMRIRNAMIISEFDRLKPQYHTITTLYSDLADKYATSSYTIKNIILNRSVNEI